MKLTTKEQEFIHDTQVYLERGKTQILIDTKKYNVSELALACKEHLGTDVWFNVVNIPMHPVEYYLETNFSKRYICDVSANTFTVITPQPFEIVYFSKLLTVSENEQRNIFKENVRFYNENIAFPKKQPLTFWQKVKQFFV